MAELAKTAASSPGALNGISVVECGQGVAAAYAAKLMADLGADVIKVEPPSGDLARRRGPFPGNTPHPEKSGLFLYLNANKRGVTLDLTQAEGRELLARLLTKADVLVHNVPLPERAAHGLDSAALCAKYPSLIVTGISIFGDKGPHANYKGYELTAVNAGGWAFLSPGASPYPDKPPLKAFGQQGDFQGGVHGAVVTLSAYLSRLKSGKGQAIEVSEQEAVAAMLEMNYMHWTYSGRETSRLGARLLGPWFMLDCADGKIFVICVEEDQWRRLVELMGNPEWAQMEIFKDRLARGANQDALKALMTEWASTWKVQDLFREGQKRRVPFAAVNRMDDLYSDPHLRERNFFVKQNQGEAGTFEVPGAPFQSDTTSWSLRRPAPRLGEHTEDVFCNQLGLTRDQLAKLKQRNIL